MKYSREFGNGSACDAPGHWQSAKLFTAFDLPTLLAAGGAIGGFHGGLLALISIISMVEFTFTIKGSPEKRSKK